MEQIVRKTAQKVRISQVLRSPYTASTKEFEPSGVTIDGEVVSRVNLMGVVVEKKHSELVLDDASSQVVVRVFDQNLLTRDVEIGSAVQVIGRVREFQGVRYIAPEAVACINHEWLKVRQKEIGDIQQQETAPLSTIAPAIQNDGVTKKFSSQINVEETIVTEIQQQTQNQKEQGLSVNTILENIRLNDTGKGANMSLIIDRLGPDSEPLLERLIEQGEIFETSPGKVKVLE